MTNHTFAIGDRVRRPNGKIVGVIIARWHYEHGPTKLQVKFPYGKFLFWHTELVLVEKVAK